VFPATTLRDAEAVVSRLRESWQASSFAPMTFSAGITSVDETDCLQEQGGQIAVRAADALMYLAKAAGRDRVECQASTQPGRHPVGADT
jgi:GGDEF domain-containing protein